MAILAMNKPDNAELPLININRKRILLIDDDPSLLNTLNSMLKNRYELVAIDSGHAALAWINKNSFDAVITDLSMPDINGEDIYHYIAEKYPQKEQYIIFTTGGGFTPEMDTFLANIKNPVLEKPFSTTQLLDVINQLLG
jgi:two-component system NtrC family sensor kinase